MAKARFWDSKTNNWIVLDAGVAERAIKADDADKFGGQLPAYYATATSVSDLQTTLTNHKADTAGHNLAAADKHGFMSSTDFTKLSGIASNATKVEASTNGKIKINGTDTTVYTHDASHPATMITTDATHRFVTDTQTSSWDGKQAALGFTPENTANKNKNNGYAGLDAGGKISVTQIPSIMKEGTVVANIAARDAISDKYQGLRVFVIDATADSTVTVGGAEYIYNGTAFVKISETESLDLVLSWANLLNKPTSSVSDIDDAVSKKHAHANIATLDLFTSTYKSNLDTAVGKAHTHANITQLNAIDETFISNNHNHTNKEVLDATTESFTTELKTKLVNLEQLGATKVESSGTNGYIKVNGTDVKVYEHPSKHVAADISDFNTEVAKVKVANAIQADKATNADFVNNICLYVQPNQPADMTSGKSAIWVQTEA